jgi:hypothetical protein
MRQWICLAVVALGLGLLANDWQGNPDAAFAAPLLPAGVGSTGLITHVQELDGKMLRVVVIDPAQRVMGIYDISGDTGEIQPKSIRNFNADLQMLEFNSGAPSPADIQNTLNRK